MAAAGRGPVDGDVRDIEDRFLACWEGIAALWGVSPAQGRIHALLLLSPRPLDGEAIRGRLGISHGACSTGLNALVARGVVHRVHPPGKRRTCYATERDGWTWIRTCLDGRRKEGGAVLEGLHEVRDFAEEAAARRRRTPGHLDLCDTRNRVRTFVRFADELAAVLDRFLSAEGPPRAAGRRGRSGGKPR